MKHLWDVAVATKKRKLARYAIIGTMIGSMMYQIIGPILFPIIYPMIYPTIYPQSNNIWYMMGCPAGHLLMAARRGEGGAALEGRPAGRPII